MFKLYTYEKDDFNFNWVIIDELNDKLNVNDELNDN